MTWFRCQNGNGGGSGTQRLYLLDPDVSDELYDITNAGQVSSLIRTFAPFVAKINNNNQSGYPEMGYWGAYGGQGNKCVLRRNGVEIGAVFIGHKIPHGVYSTLYVNCEVIAYNNGYQHAEIWLSPDGSLDAYCRPGTSLKTVTLVDKDKTAAEINAQTGVVITSTDPLLLSAQTVEIDISNISQDFYFAFWNCDRTVQIRSIYLE